MRREQEAFDPGEPNLIVTYGNTTRKHRPLDREVIVLGRGTNCDLMLMATEVAPIHCLLIRLDDGRWRVRHFGSRVGTLVNGKPILDEVVEHDDTIQIGTFSFRLHLPCKRRPAGAANNTAPNAEVKRLQRSRRNLARLALSLRARYLTTVSELTAAQDEIEQQRQDLDALRTSGRARQQALDTLRAAGGRRDKESAPEDRLQSMKAIEEQTRRLQQRSDELDHYAQHLRQVADQLAQRQAQPEQRPQASSGLRERLAKVQQIKNGLASLRGFDSAPGGKKPRDAEDPSDLFEIGEFAPKK